MEPDGLDRSRRALAEVLDTAVAGGSVDDILRVTARAVEGLVPQYAITICVVDADGRSLVEVASSSLPSELSQKLRLLESSERLGTTGPSDPLVDEAWSPYRNSIDSCGYAISWVAPVRDIDAEVAGYIIALGRDEVAPPTETNRVRLGILADLLGIVLHHRTVQKGRLNQIATMEGVARLASDVAHDFSNVLHGIGMVADEARSSRDPSELRAALDDIASFVSRGERLIDRLQASTSAAAAPSSRTSKR